ncbi:MAG: hypothetical protein ACD_18C00158G0004 [uncultured bacterium]|nr:MAG: hypothetical protein ACD_18C00158G0004 [uncultured bacterium]
MSQENKNSITLKIKNFIIISIIVISLVSYLVFSFGHKSIYEELNITLLIIASILFLFLSIGIYHGLNIEPQEKITKWRKFKTSIFDTLYHFDLNIFNIMEIGGIVGIIMAIIMWIVVSIFLLVILTFLANLIWGLLLFLFGVTYWIFYRALHQVFLKTKKCKGNLLKSIYYSLFYTIMYIGWIFILIYINNL